MAWDFHRAGVDFWAWMADLLSDAPTRSPGYLLALVDWLPDDGATAASMRGGREHYGFGQDRRMVADLWNLHAAVAHGQGVGKGKPPTYPWPGEKRKRGRPLFDLAPNRRPPA